MTLPAEAAPGLAGASARQLRQLLSDGEVSATEVLAAHLALIADRNPQINAVCTLSPDRAFGEARAADDAFARGSLLGPLHGIPILHKDLLDTAGVCTTYGSEAYRDHVPDLDSLMVARCKAAGAVMMGKTNTPQFGTGGHTSNSLFGTTVNPIDPTLTAGGSSGGSAAALAAGMSPLATGTDMAGSLRIPAAFCGVVGLRPTPGRIPWWPTRWGDMYYSVAGPMARTVDDLWLLLHATAGPDSRATHSRADLIGDERLDPFDPAGRPLRVAWAPQIAGLPVAPDVADVLACMPEVVRATGATLLAAEPDVSGAEMVFRVFRARYYAQSYGRLLQERPEMLDERTATNTREGLELSIGELEHADLARSALEARSASFFARHDFLLLPCAPVTAFSAGQWGPATVDGTPLASYLDWLRHTYYISAMGLPALSLPVGVTRAGMPVAVQVVAAPGRDREVVQFARSLEALLAVPDGVWSKPRHA